MFLTQMESHGPGQNTLYCSGPVCAIVRWQTLTTIIYNTRAVKCVNNFKKKTPISNNLSTPTPTFPYHCETLCCKLLSRLWSVL